MKKQNLTLSQKFVAATFAALLATSSAVAVPTAAFAMGTLTPQEAVKQQLYGDPETYGANGIYGLIQLYAKYSHNGSRLDYYELCLGKERTSDVVWRATDYCATNFDVSSTPYVLDLSDKGYKISPFATLLVRGRGTQKIAYGYTDDEFIYNSSESLQPEECTDVSMFCQYDSATINRIEFRSDKIVVYLDRYTNDAYKEVEKAIDAIGEVSYRPESEFLIAEAEEAYHLLPNREKYAVSNYVTLLEAKYAYAEAASKA